MTAAENKALSPRATPDFRFYLAGEEFRASAGTTLHFASKADDLLSMPAMPHGMFTAGAAVHVTYKGTRVFSGTVEKIVDRAAGGPSDGDRVDDVTVAGPWSKMNRLVFRQQWATKTASGEDATFLFSRVVLNRTLAGGDMSLHDQVQEIVDYAATPCGFTRGTISADSLVLPADETRDLTCASALLRELRFHPKRIVRFDYSSATPALNVVDPSAADAAYLATVPKTAREYEANVHPITAVDVQTNDVTTVLSKKVSSAGHQIYPAGEDVTGLDVLHAYVPLARGSASTSFASCDVVTEDVPDLGSASWWKARHPRLAGVAASAIAISEPGYGGTYPRIARNPAAELKAAGLHFAVENFHCKCTITTADDVEEDVYLSMEYVTTDATTRTYTWQTGSSSTSGETLPSGLAEAIYRQRTQSAYLNETVTMRLADALPTLGDAADGLFLQSFDVDCRDLTATLHFGQPEYLSVEDMRDLLNGFRGRAYASNAVLRAEAEEEDAAEEIGPIMPLSSTEFAPGTKAKTSISTASSGSIVLDSGELDSDETAEVHEITYKDGEETKSAKILATEDVHLDGTTGSGEDGDGDDDYCNNISGDDDGGDGDDGGNGISGDGNNKVSKNPCSKGDGE